jgi:hypothetical protein
MAEKKDWTVEQWIEFMDGRTKLLYTPSPLPSHPPLSLSSRNIGDEGATRIAEALKVNTSVTEIE